MVRLVAGVCACLIVLADSSGPAQAQEQVAQLPIPSPEVLIIGVRAQADKAKPKPPAEKKPEEKKPEEKKPEEKKPVVKILEVNKDEKKDGAKKEDCCGEGECESDVGDCKIDLKSMKEHKPEVEKKPLKSEDPKGALPKVNIEEKFYKKCAEFQGTVPVPSEVSRKVEKLQFERKTYNVGDCQYTICMPTHQCVITCKSCELRQTKAKLEACTRTCDGNVDVYVLDIPGMPPRWPIMVGASKDEVEKRFGIKLDELKEKK